MQLFYYEYDSSDDEPLAEKAKRIRRHQPDQPVWRKSAPIYTLGVQENADVENRQKEIKENLGDLTPVQIFEKICDEEVITLIISNTVLYATQNNRHSFQLNPTDLKKFIGFLILSGYHKLPREDLYWSYDEDVGVKIVSSALSRQKFRDIKRNFHFVNNDEATNSRDKMFKVRPLADILMKFFLQWGVMHEHISIDESMVKYFGHHPSKQFIRGKPVRFGYENWVAASQISNQKGIAQQER